MLCALDKPANPGQGHDSGSARSNQDGGGLRARIWAELLGLGSASSAQNARKEARQ